MNFERGKDPKKSLNIGRKGISIVSDGSAKETYVYYNGEYVEGVTEVNISFKVGTPTEIDLKMIEIPGKKNGILKPPFKLEGFWYKLGKTIGESDR